MDITNIPQTLIKGLEQKNTEQLVALSRVLNLVLGKTHMAEISSTKPVTEPERAELIKQTAAALAQINKQVSNPNNLTPALKAEISRLLQQQNLVQSPELKWVNLVVNNRPLLTYSDRPLTAGQTIPVQLQGPQKLVLLDLPEADSTTVTPAKNLADSVATSTNIQSPITKNIAALNELLKTALANLTPQADAADNNDANISKQISTTNTTTYSAKDLSLKFSIQTDNKNTNPITTATKTVVSENLRNLLPQKDTPNVLLSTIAKLQQLPLASRSQLISPSLEQALKSVAAQIRLPEQLSQPKVLAQVLKNSGNFFEHKLNEAVQNNGAQNSNSQIGKNSLNNTYSQDLKGALLTLLNRTTQDMNGDKRPLSNEQTQKLIQQIGSTPFFNPSLGATSNGVKGDIAQVLNLFMQQLMLKPAKELSDKELRTQLLTLLQQHSVHSLAKIQLQQLHSLNHELDTKDSATPNASWQIEIPVKHHNDVHQLHVRIDREWVDEKNESDTEKTITKVKQWSVTLTFDLPTLGEFCAQLAIINTQVSATLWAAQEKTFTHVREQIEGLRKQLESEGINVKYLQCVRGVPPQKPMALSYSLIDIST
jgi:hypothetical protein